MGKEKGLESPIFDTYLAETRLYPYFQS